MHATRNLTALLATAIILAASACATSFPAATLDWGHGATPLADGQSRLQVGLGGGAGALVIPPETTIPILGAGGGASFEHQVSQDLLLRAEAGGGIQTPGVVGGSFNAPFTTPLAGYLGAQYNFDPGFALRLRMGGGVELTKLPDEAGIPFVVNPFVGSEVGVVFSQLLGGIETYEEVRGGAKLPLAPASAGGGSYLPSLPIPQLGATLGVRLPLGDHSSIYGAVHADGQLQGFVPIVSGSGQLGYTLAF